MKNFASLFLFLAIAYNSFAQSPTITDFQPRSAASGMTVVITGTNFTGTTAVRFGGTAARSFNIVNSTTINAVVALGTNGNVQVVNGSGSGSMAGFLYVPTSGIVTDFGGFWYTTGAAVNATNPNNSHNLLAFTYNDQIYSTGVNDAALAAGLTPLGQSFTPSQYKALPVAGVSGVYASGSTYLALASGVDGSLNIANPSAVSNYSVKMALTDGINGLNMGTGVTNLPASASMTFQISNMNLAAVTDNEPDILLTQIASPSAGNDVFSFVDGSNNIVGNSVTQDMTLLPSFGTYVLDLFTLAPNTPYNQATAYGVASSGTNTTRNIRLSGYRLSDFGITPANVGSVKALRITPSGNSDYAFIAYNASTINLPPNLSQNSSLTNTTVCTGGTVNMAVLGAPSAGGVLSYSWEESTNGGSSWTPITNGGNYSGATTDRLRVVAPLNNNRYRVTLSETGNVNTATSTFTVTVSTATPPSAVTAGSTATICRNTVTQLTSTVTGGSNLLYQWQTNASGSFADIPGANLDTYLPPVNQTGVTSYRVIASSGSGCGSVTSSAVVLTVTGVASTTGAQICQGSTATLNATSTSGAINWYADDLSGSSLGSNNSFLTPTLNASRNYYAVSAACPSGVRVPVLASVAPTTVGGTVTGGNTVVTGNNSTTLTLTGNTGNVLKWQSSTDNFNVVISDIPNTTTQLTATNLNENTQFRAQVQSSPCTPTFSSFASMVVSGVLPIHDKSLKTTRENNSIVVQWTAYDQQNTQEYEIERSADGVNFSSIAVVPARDIYSPVVSYKWTDASPMQRNNFYRIREILRSGSTQYSGVVKLVFENGKQGVGFFPNPVNGKTANLQFNDMRAGIYTLRFINSAGQTVSQQTVSHAGGYRSQAIQLASGVKPGHYKVEISGPAGSRDLISVLVL